MPCLPRESQVVAAIGDHEPQLVAGHEVKEDTEGPDGSLTPSNTPDVLLRTPRAGRIAEGAFSSRLRRF